jgi:hypothetical protein
VTPDGNSGADLATLHPDERLMVCLTPTDVVGDLPVIWRDESFSRERWPMPWFSINSGIPEFPIDAVRTSDDDPFSVIETRAVSPHDARELPNTAPPRSPRFWRSSSTSPEVRQWKPST